MRSSLKRVGPWVLATILGLLTTVVSVTPAQAQTDPVEVNLTGVTVSGTSPDSEVVITGTVTNTSDDPVYAVQVLMWRSTDRLRDVATLGSVTTGEQTPEGSRLVSSESNYATIVENGGPFAPKARASFTVRATMAQLKFPTTGAPYVMGVDVRGNTDGTSRFQTLTRARVTVPIPASTTSVSSATAVVLSSQPSRISGKTFSDDHVAKEIAKGGRLDTLLSAVEKHKVSYIIDTALLDEVRRMAEGYSVTVSETEAVEGTGSAAATAWLERFDDLPQTTGYRTLFASPDVATAAIASDSQVLRRAERADAELSGRVAELPLVILPTDLAADAQTISYLKDSGAAAIATRLLSTEATWVAGDIPALRVSAPSSPQYVNPTLGANLVSASEAMILGASGHTQVRILSTVAEVEALSSAPSWVTLVPLSHVMNQLPSSTPATFATVSTSTGLGNDVITATEKLATDLDDFVDLAPRTLSEQQANDILARSVSSAWVGSSQDRDDWLTTATQPVTEALDGGKVSLTASRTFVMSGKVNEFPITVTNELSHSIEVQVTLTSSNPQRLRVMNPELVTVGPGESRTVNIRPEATANGVVEVEAQLETRSHTSLGEPITITVEATEYGMWGWVLVVVSGLTLVGTTAWSLLKSRGRTRAKEAA